ncbi:conserved hypothetical protein [Candidatus Terasakiella magnetica]|uniref:MmcQ/YjbR family DNA-binding protein n=1 Tax=Candidatus Terasakiella magnetica TaxID=1867952 RepID=A0A1C3RK98_9PROT|nr:MmcQ/YjbR family DNA-binding protein [Candidatus Terasakiella magnetica]SCA57742.1 conserved hypothetical protein [Candidatus Terasakiella magnetica]
MTRDEFDTYCAQLTAATHVVQWGGASVWKVGGKIFALAPIVEEGSFQKISFKVSDFAYEILTQQQGIIPAPYLARAKWVQINSDDTMSEADLKSHLRDAHEIIASKLTKKMRAQLGL